MQVIVFSENFDFNGLKKEKKTETLISYECAITFCGVDEVGGNIAAVELHALDDL